MTAKIITVSSGKGGVGKTTTTANLAISLATLGHRVICIDADIGLRNLDVMLGLENRIVYDIVNYVEDQCRFRQVLVRDKRFPELYLIPAAQTRDKNAITIDDMAKVAYEAAEMADYVLIDSPAGIEHGFRYAVTPANLVLIVTNPEVTAVRDADRVIGLLEAEGWAPAKLIINRFKPDMVKRNEMLDADTVVDLLAIELIGVVPEDERILAASNRGAPVALDSKSPAGEEFRNIARRLNGEDIPIITERKTTFISRLFGGR